MSSFDWYLWWLKLEVVIGGIPGVIILLATVYGSLWVIRYAWRMRTNLVGLDGIETPYYIAYVIRDGKEILVWDDTRSSLQPQSRVAYNKILDHFEKTGEGQYRVYMAIRKSGVGSYQQRYNMYDVTDINSLVDKTRNRKNLKAVDKAISYVSVKTVCYDAMREPGYKYPPYHGLCPFYEGDPPVRKECDTREDIPAGCLQKISPDLYPDGFLAECRTPEHLAKCAQPMVMLDADDAMYQEALRNSPRRRR